jgi:hypothetical protein
MQTGNRNLLTRLSFLLRQRPNKERMMKNRKRINIRVILLLLAAGLGVGYVMPWAKSSKASSTITPMTSATLAAAQATCDFSCQAAGGGTMTKIEWAGGVTAVTGDAFINEPSPSFTFRMGYTGALGPVQIDFGGQKFYRFDIGAGGNENLTWCYNYTGVIHTMFTDSFPPAEVATVDLVVDNFEQRNLRSIEYIVDTFGYQNRVLYSQPIGSITLPATPSLPDQTLLDPAKWATIQYQIFWPIPGSSMTGIPTTAKGVFSTSACPTETSLIVANTNDSGEGSLRAVIASAQPGDTIGFDSSVFNSPQAITLTSGELVIAKSLTIQGPGANLLTVSGNNASRIFNIPAGNFDMTIEGMTIANGLNKGADASGTGSARGEDAKGGGIYNASVGTVKVTNCVLTGNTAQGGNATGNLVVTAGTGFGGAIYQEVSAGTLKVTNCLLANNRAISGIASGGTTNRVLPSLGGGICNLSGATVNVNQSTFTGNSAMSGGGLFSDGSLTINASTFTANQGQQGGGAFIYAEFEEVTVKNSTFSGNSVGPDGMGAGLAAWPSLPATVAITNCTIANNHGDAGALGGGLFANAGPPIKIQNTIIAGNTAPGGGDDIYQLINSLGHNLIGNGDGVIGLSNGVNGDQVGTANMPINPQLGPLADNGGPTQTHALLAGSPAIDQGACLPTVTTDQRGITRPQGAGCDVGAFEFEPPVVLTCPDNLTAVTGTDSNQCGVTVNYTAPTASSPVTCTPPSGALFAVGTTTVNCSTAAGQSCSFTVTVIDNTTPTINCPANITTSTDANQCAAVVNFSASASDNCSTKLTPVCQPPSGSTFNKGTTTVNCTATDEAKNSASCSFAVTVNDRQAPTITCSADIVFITAQPGDTTMVINYPAPTASDNCGLASVVCAPPSGSAFPVGTTTVTCTATDSSTNQASCSFTVSTFDVCLQDDSDSRVSLMWSSQTGVYRFCVDGTVYIGQGTATRRGRVFTLMHNPADRRLTATADTSAYRGNAILQAPPGTNRVVITDRDTRNNLCNCQ